MKTRTILSLAAVMGFAAFSTPSKAQNLSATFIEINPALTFEATLDNGNTVWYSMAGVMKFDTFDAFCIDAFQPIGSGETVVYQIQNPLTLEMTHTISRLVGGYLASSQSAQDAAAVQWAIWETLVEDISAPSLSDGRVRITDSAATDTIALANQYLTNFNDFAPASLTYLQNDTLQDMVTWSAIPEPNTVVIAAFSGLLLFRRRRG
jgi:hypothetical protein